MLRDGTHPLKNYVPTGEDEEEFGKYNTIFVIVDYPKGALHYLKLIYITTWIFIIANSVVDFNRDLSFLSALLWLAVFLIGFN